MVSCHSSQPHCYTSIIKVTSLPYMLIQTRRLYGTSTETMLGIGIWFSKYYVQFYSDGNNAISINNANISIHHRCWRAGIRRYANKLLKLMACCKMTSVKDFYGDTIFKLFRKIFNTNTTSSFSVIVITFQFPILYKCFNTWHYIALFQNRNNGFAFLFF